MIEELMTVNGYNEHIPTNSEDQIRLLNALRTVTAPAEFSQAYYEAEDAFLQARLSKKEIIRVVDIDDVLLPNIYIHKGDITAIEADAIVNAANEKLLGCFIPGHHCIDNAIHMAAGQRLRVACNSLMEAQGNDEETGRAKITKAYNLPAKYVVHTVGPNMNEAHKYTNQEAANQALKACYISILEGLQAYEDVVNVVFCSISTGVYGVSIEEASMVALETISDFLKTHDHHFNKVVMDVFSQEDYDAYKKTAQVYGAK